MPRPLRIEYEGALYHVTDRGVERREIFLDDCDYQKFLVHLRAATTKYNLVVHALCLIPNHYHLECETPEANLSKAMQWLNTCYAVYFNKRHGRVGHLFQGRYNAVLVQKERHLLELTRYIHLNPVRAGLVSSPEEYHWSSYGDYVGECADLGWIETEWTLSQFGRTLKESRSTYRAFVREGLRTKLESPLDAAVEGAVLGDETFISWIEKKFLKGRPLRRSLPPSGSIDSMVPLVQVIEATSLAYGIPAECLLKKGSHFNTARDIALYLSRECCALNNTELGQEFGGILSSSVSNICRKTERLIQEDEGAARLVSRIRSSLTNEA